jgi:hypothetical protein
MIKRLIDLESGRVRLLGLVLIVVGVVLVDGYFVANGFSYREVIVGVVASMVGIIVLGRERGIQFGLVLWVITLALGYRTVQWTSNLRIHPSEVLLWLLLLCICAQPRLLSQTRLRLPLWLWLFIPFWALGWWPLIAGAAPWDKMLNEFRNFLLLIPLMIVATAVLERERYWRYLLLAFFAVSTWIAVMGVTEYWFPGVSRLIPEFVTSVKPTNTREGFVRAAFSFWGGQTATFICVLAVPTAIVLATWWSQWWARIAIVAAAVFQLTAIYIGGYRSIWLVVLLQAPIASLLRLRKHGVVVALLCLVVAVGGYQVIPKTDERLASGIAAVQLNPTDHSALVRKERALTAWNTALDSPFGIGWSHVGWVHSDFLQVAANLGVIAGLIFLGGYIYTLVRLTRRLMLYFRSAESGDLGVSLLLSFLGAGGLLAAQGVQVLPQLMLPVWFVWVLVEIWLVQTSGARQTNEVLVDRHSYQLTRAQSFSYLKTNV